MKGDQQLLIVAMARMYRKVIVESFKRCLSHWVFILVHLGYFLLVALVSAIAGSFGGLLGGFMLGLFLAVVLSSYFLTISLTVQDERFSLREIAERTFELFGPILNVLFALFLIKLLGQFVFTSPQTQWLEKVLNLLITILLNPIPEIIYQKPAGLMDMCADSFEFVKENSIEWFVPIVLLLSPLAVYSPFAVKDLLIFFTTTNPFDILELAFVSLSHPSLLYAYGFHILLFVAVTFYLFVFRGMLYQELATSSRRRRIYQARMEEG